MITGKVNILPSYKINEKQWNDCVSKAPNSLIYATTNYLNNMAGNWQGIIINDYETVMPVPWRKKFGVRYACDVPFIQQLGWFGKTQDTDATKLEEQLFKFVKYGDYNFNYANVLPDEKATSKTNFVLQLNTNPVKNIFSKSYVSSLQKAKQQQLHYAQGEVEEAIFLFKKFYSEAAKQISETSFENFTALCKQLQAANNCFVRKIISANDTTLSICLLLKDEKRLYNIINATAPEGRKKESNYLLYEQVFEEFAQINLLFDFEGSDIPGVKSFYQKFNVINQPYYTMHFNHLPIPLRWLKR